MNWLNIADIGSSKVVKSMLIWMLITPIFAKSLSSVNTVQLPFFHTDNDIYLGLPFSWHMFFFCALSFTIANIIYSYKCPSLIRKYKNYSDFEAKDNSMYLAVDYFNHHVNEKVVRNNFLELGGIVATYTPSKEIAEEWTSDDTSNTNWRRGISSLKHTKEGYKPDVFSSLRILLAKLYPGWIWLCVCFYGIGFLTLAIVLLQNIIFVVKQTQF